MSETDWWQTMFDEKYLDTYLGHLSPERTNREVDFIVEAAKLQPSDTILDLACGHGRHAIELARRGFHNITGLDYSETFIDKAVKDAEDAGAQVNFVRGDMKKLDYENQFDVVLTLFTTFGYFDDETNKAVLGQINGALKPGGRFFIDVISGEAVMKRFEAEGLLDAEKGLPKIPRQEDMSGHMVDETEWFDKEKQVVETHREWQEDGKKREYDYWLHVYTMPQYQQMLTDTGFKIEETWGDFEGRAYGDEGTHRTIILATILP